MQQYAAELGTQRRPDGSYEYEVVVWFVPRQVGKTTGLRATGTHRCLVCGRDVFYTAQTGKHARARWMELVEKVQNAPAFAGLFDLTLRGGSEALHFKRSPDGPIVGSFGAFPPTEDSLHSFSPPCVFIDEAWKLKPGAGELLIGAAEPGQMTLVDGQIWIVSTAGTAQSVFLHEWVERAIEGEPRVAILDWGARDNQDPYNLDDIAAFHPGVGVNFNGKIVTPADILKSANKLSRSEYERAYANRPTVTASHLIPVETFVALRAMSDIEHTAPTGCVLTFDVGADREGSALLATWLEDGTACSQVIAAAPGVRWLVDAVEGAARKLRPVTMAAAENGPVLEVTAQLLARGHDITTLTEREFATSTGGLLTRIDEGSIRHDGNAEGTDVLSRSVTGVVTRAGAVDGVAISRRHSVGDTSAAVALAVGVHVATLVPETKPFTVFAAS